jgi:hypothetical protein
MAIAGAIPYYIIAGSFAVNVSKSVRLSKENGRIMYSEFFVFAPFVNE